MWVARNPHRSPGSWPQRVSEIRKSQLSINRPQLNPPKPAERVLLLPPGEGRDEGRLRSSSLNGSWSQRGKLLSSFLSINRPQLNPPKPAERVLLLPPGEGRDEGRLRSSSLIGSWSQRGKLLSSFLSLNRPQLNPPKPAESVLLLPREKAGMRAACDSPRSTVHGPNAGNSFRRSSP